VKVGDLIAHKSNGVLGVIVKEVQSRISMLDNNYPEDGLFSIRWFDGITHHHTNHWWHELEKMSL